MTSLTDLDTCPTCGGGMQRNAEHCSRCRIVHKRQANQIRYRALHADEIRRLEWLVDEYSDEASFVEFSFLPADEVRAALKRKRQNCQRRIAYLRRLCGEP